MTRISSLITAFAAAAGLMIATPTLAAYPQVDGTFSISVTNQPASNQYCVGDSISFSLDLSNIPTTNPQNKSDATFVSVMVMGPPQGSTVDPTGISNTPRGLVVGALGFTPISSFSGSATYVVEDKLKGFTRLFFRAIVFYESQSSLFESFQTAASTQTSFSIASSCNAPPTPQQVEGSFTISVTNQPANNQYCVGDSVAFSLDLSNIPKVNPKNSSDATYLSVMIMGPPQDPSVDPFGISKTPRGLVVGALGNTLVSTFSGSATYVVESKLKGFTGLFLRAIVFYESQSWLFEAFQTSASAQTTFAIAPDCGSTYLPSSSVSPTGTLSPSYSPTGYYGGSSSSLNSTSSILYSGALDGASASRAALVGIAVIPVLMLFA
ncbi:hypothetical protein DFJ73DRAFT_854591 [Zopfochytrium polystomum]|nr:hypothetical protein DFJ73DRAFT_854591 [Zopfochytrium polystomum]